MRVPGTCKLLYVLFANIWMSSGIGSEFVFPHQSRFSPDHPVSNIGGPAPVTDKFRGLQISLQGTPATARGIGRSVLLSVLLLITVIVAGTYTLRKDEPSKETRECPLKFMLADDTGGSYSRKCSVPLEQMRLDDYPVGWMDTLLATKTMQCIFDPGVIMLETLLSLPPPTFIRKVGTESSELNAIIAQFQSLRKTYVSLSDGN